MLSTLIHKRYGLSQILAASLLLIYLAQAGFLASHSPLSGAELQYTQPQAGSAVAGAGPELAASSMSSPLTGRMAGALSWLGGHVWLPRIVFMVFGALLGASLWYVARRLYGNAGGYIALTLFAFSPSMISYAARVQPEIAAAWGTFGCIFTGIAVAHTLYAPREVVLWNWRRIVLLAVALGMGMSAELSIVIAVPIALAFMFYLVPERRGAAVVILGAATALASILMIGIYGFHFGELAQSIRALGDVAPGALLQPASWKMVGVYLLHNGAGFVLLLIGALVTYAAWRRTRFFGNTAPLLVAVLFIITGLALPHAAGFSFLVVALPFLFVFIAGIGADLLQTRYSSLAFGIISAALAMHAWFSLGGLLRLGR